MSSTSSTAATPSRAEDDRVYTLDDLKSWERVRPGLPPSLAVLGHPVAHSVSPQMHNAALAELAKKHPQLRKWRYFKFDIEPSDLKQALDLLRAKNFRGVNLTLPHKIEAAKLVGSALVSMTPLSAVNTLLVQQEDWEPYNTDEFGFIEALRYELGVNLKNASVVVLGVGGAGMLAAFLASRCGCVKLWVGNRTPKKLDSLLMQLQVFGGGNRIQRFDLAEPPIQDWPHNAVIINATPVGLRSGDKPVLSVAQLGSRVVIFDMTYQRGGSTPLVAAARARGLRATDGLSMLVWQGAMSLCIWLKAHLHHEITPEPIAQTMMDAACKALGIERRIIPANA